MTSSNDIVNLGFEILALLFIKSFKIKSLTTK